MAKPKTFYACQSCGYRAPKWLGKCPDCNQWNTFAEERLERATSVRGELSLGTKEDPAPIHEINTAEEGRLQCGIGEFDRVLGGGLVPGSVILIGRSEERRVGKECSYGWVLYGEKQIVKRVPRIEAVDHADIQI